jgi:8-oxo-dGTP pyrophosphatase MutT (NUDIX family)
VLKKTLCLIVREGEILLAMKKRGFGAGKWNGYGGKLLVGESLEQAAIRETKEEINVGVGEKDLKKVAILNFYYSANPHWDCEVHIFLIQRFQGNPKESEEMQPQWFKFNEIPFEQMWADDKHWLPKVLAGKVLEGEFYFNPDLSLKNFELKESQMDK